MGCPFIGRQLFVVGLRLRSGTRVDFSTGAILMNEQQLHKVKQDRGFIAALGQSSGSTPKALELYGIAADAYSDDDEMFALIHQMRTRMITSPGFNGDRILGAILFESTMDRDIEGKGSADYLWRDKRVVPFLKVDNGLDAEIDGVQTMKPIPGLDALLARAREKGIFGTKMRSVIKRPDDAGIKAVVDQQFELARQILAADLVPIVEPEVDLNSPEKARVETLLKAAIIEQVSQLDPPQLIMLKLTLPEVDNFYAELLPHPSILHVVALSGGYTRQEANTRLARNHGVIASFSRALSEGLSVRQSDEDFNAALDRSIATMFEASDT
jgi:fructose-bisphosphate aldolase class I